jgi:hypothetical protein
VARACCRLTKKSGRPYSWQDAGRPEFNNQQEKVFYHESALSSTRYYHARFELRRDVTDSFAGNAGAAIAFLDAGMTV